MASMGSLRAQPFSRGMRESDHRHPSPTSGGTGLHPNVPLSWTTGGTKLLEETARIPARAEK
jgi:hypothetical protein